MARQNYSSTDPRMFTIPACDNLGDAFLGYGIDVETCIRRSKQRGVFTFRSALRNVQEGADGPIVASLEETYPNATSQTWEAFWFAHTNKVSRMAEAYRADQNRAEATRM